MILAALALAAGLGRAIFGGHSAKKQGQSERDQIKRAYQISERRLGEDEAYTREGANESLNARGILNGGANSGRSSAIRDALAAGATATTQNAAVGAAVKSGKLGAIIKTNKAGGGADARKEATEQARMATAAERGQTGDASTLSGQTNSDLSREFYGEQQDLWSQRQAAINASKRGESAARIGAIGAGIDTAASVYQGGKMIQGAFGAQAPPAAAATPGTPGYQPIKSTWFGGYDPSDPLGLAKKRGITNDEFNVKADK